MNTKSNKYTLRTTIRTAIRIICIFLIVALFFIQTMPAIAISNPDAMYVFYNGNKAFQNIFVYGDILFINEYKITYTATPPEAANQTFVFTLQQPGNGALISSVPLQGYNSYFAAMYFTPTQVASSGITWGTNYTVKVAGNPTYFPVLTEDINMITRNLATSDWIADGVTTSKAQLYDFLLLNGASSVAERMQQDNGETYIFSSTTGTKSLNTLGAQKFLLALPGLQSALPQLFQTSSGTVIVTNLPATSAYQSATDIDVTLGPQISSAFSGIGQWLGISKLAAAGSWILFIALTVMSITFLNSGNTTAAVITGIPIIVMGAQLGIIQFSLLFTVTLFVAAYMFYYIWLRGT